MSRTSPNRRLKPSSKKKSRVPDAKPTSKPQPKATRPYAPGYGIVATEDGKGLLPWSWVVKKMSNCRTFWLATVHANEGRPHVMPIWGVWLDDAFFFSTGSKSRKGQNLAANPACTITNDDGEEAVIVEGEAAKVGNADTLKRLAGAYMKKYKMDPRSMGEPIYIVNPTCVFGFEEKTFAQSATRWLL